MRTNRNKMLSDTSLVLCVTILLAFCIEKACTETDDGTASSVPSDDVSVYNTPPMIESSSIPSASDSTTAKPPSDQFPPNDVSFTQVPLGSTTDHLSDTQFPPSSAIPRLLQTSVAPMETKSELLNTLVTPSQTSTAASFNNSSPETELEQTRASSLDAEVASTAGSAAGIPWMNNNVTDDTLTTTTTVSATALTPTTTLSNQSYDVISVDNETTVFPFMDNATDYKNDTNMTSIDDSDRLGNTMTSLMTQTPDEVTTIKPTANMDTSKAPELSSSSTSSFLSSKSSQSFSEDTRPPPPHSLPPPHSPHSPAQPQEMTVKAKVALGFGVIVGITCVVIVATVTVRQCLGYWARRDYSSLEQDNISFS